jgi:hypothetical protein
MGYDPRLGVAKSSISRCLRSAATKFVGKVMHLTLIRDEIVSNSQEASPRLLREANDDSPV